MQGAEEEKGTSPKKKPGPGTVLVVPGTLSAGGGIPVHPNDAEIINNIPVVGISDPVANLIITTDANNTKFGDRTSCMPKSENNGLPDTLKASTNINHEAANKLGVVVNLDDPGKYTWANPPKNEDKNGAT